MQATQDTARRGQTRRGAQHGRSFEGYIPALSTGEANHMAPTVSRSLVKFIL